MLAKSLSWRSIPEISQRGSVQIHPHWQAFCDTHQLIDAQAFLDLRGEIVSGHIRRHVLEMSLGKLNGYLKKEHSIRGMDRLTNWWQGCGWSSKSTREGKLLQKLDRPERFAPPWIAFGECDGQAFLLIEKIADAIDLRQFLAGEREQGREQFACHLGEWVARLHRAGFDHPDLYAKHILVNPDTWKIRALDWQRSRFYRQIPLAARCRSLAALEATLPQPSYFHSLIEQYLYESELPISLSQMLAFVRSHTRIIQEKSSVRRQREVEGVEPIQRLLWLDGEALCVIPEMKRSFESTDLADWVYDPTNDGSIRFLPDGRRVRVQVSRYSWSMSRIGSRLRGKLWRAEEMKLARETFALERRGKSRKKLLAFGQRELGLHRAEAFVLFEETP